MVLGSGMMGRCDRGRGGAENRDTLEADHEAVTASPLPVPFSGQAREKPRVPF